MKRRAVEVLFIKGPPASFLVNANSLAGVYGSKSVCSFWEDVISFEGGIKGAEGLRSNPEESDIWKRFVSLLDR